MLSRPLRPTMISVVRGELVLADEAGSGAVGLFDPLVDFGTRVAEFRVVGFVVAAGGRVAGVLALVEVTYVVAGTVVRVEFVGSSFAGPAGGVAGVLTLTEVALVVAGTVVGLVRVGSSFAGPIGRVAGVLTFAEVAFFVGGTIVVLVSSAMAFPG